MKIGHFIFSMATVFLVWAMSSRALTSFEIIITIMVAMVFFEVVFRSKKTR